MIRTRSSSPRGWASSHEISPTLCSTSSCAMNASTSAWGRPACTDGNRKDDKSVAIAVNGPRVVNDMEMSILAAIDSVGLAFSFEEYVAPHLASGALVRVLEDWCPPFAGFFLYNPSRRQQPAALSALIDARRFSDARK